MLIDSSIILNIILDILKLQVEDSNLNIYCFLLMPGNFFVMVPNTLPPGFKIIRASRLNNALVWIPSEPHAQKMPWGCDNYCGKAFLLSKIPFCMYFALTCQIHQVDWWWERIARHRGGNTLWCSCSPVIFIALAAWVCGLIVSDLGKPGTIRTTLNPWNILQQVMTQCPGCSLKFPTLDLSQCGKCSKKDNVGSQIDRDAIDVLFFFFVSCLWLIVSRFWC